MLVVVDQPVLAEVVRLALGHANLQARVVPSIDAAMNELDTKPPNLAVIDADVGDGEILARIQDTVTAGTRLPVLALTRRGDLSTKLKAFAHGVDDIVTMPFSPEELVARVWAIMRRTYGPTAKLNPIIRLGELEIDIMRRSVTAGGHELRLTSLEQSLLYLFAANAGRLLTRDEILDHLVGIDYAVRATSSTVTCGICGQTAKRLAPPRYIATVPGKGYRFVPTDPQ